MSTLKEPRHSRNRALGAAINKSLQEEIPYAVEYLLAKDIQQVPTLPRGISMFYVDLEDMLHCVPSDSRGRRAIARHLALNRQRDEILKKYVPPGQESELKHEAIRGFVFRNSKAGYWNSRWLEVERDSAGLPMSLNEVTRTVLANARCYMTNWLSPVDELAGDPARFMSRGRFGPGSAVSDAETMELPSEMTADFIYKLLLRYPGTPSVPAGSLWVNFFKAHIWGGEDHLDGNIPDPPCPLVSAARLATVRKDRLRYRVILVGTPVGSWITLAIGEHLTEVLRCLGIRIESQAEVNMAMAQWGSRDLTQLSDATLDVKDSSDSFYNALVRWLMEPVPALARLMEWSRDRSYCAKYPPLKGEKPDDVCEKLNIFCTMGNGFTFPLQTMFYLALAYAVNDYASLRGAHVPKDDRIIHHQYGFQTLPRFSVFGDDVILPRRLASVYSDVLSDIGFTVNEDKSFTQGPFRESCGKDFMYGINVRPVYLTQVRTWHEVTTLVNRLLLWGANWDVPLTRTISYLVGLLPAQYRNPVPIWENIDAGLLTPWSLRPVSVNVDPVFRAHVQDAGGVPYLAFRPAMHRRPLPDLFGAYASAKIMWQTIDSVPFHPNPFRKEKVGWRSFVSGPAMIDLVRFATLSGHVADATYSVRTLPDVPSDYTRSDAWSFHWDYPPAIVSNGACGEIKVSQDMSRISWSRFDSWRGLADALELQWCLCLSLWRE